MKLTDADKQSIRESYFSKDSRETGNTLARIYKVSTSTIYKIVRLDNTTPQGTPDAPSTSHRSGC